MTTPNHRVALVYLARKAEGLDPLLRFKAAYQAYPGGEAHDFVVIYKGFENDEPALNHAHGILQELHPTVIYINDEGIDITAYLDAAKRLEHEELCFLNTFSEPQGSNWLRKLLSQLRRPGVGIVGATASYESLRSSMDLLSKVFWLCAVKGVPRDEELVRYYRWFLELQYPAWLAQTQTTSIVNSLKKWIFGRVCYQDYDEEYARYWQHVTQPGGLVGWAQLFHEFPNPHIRSNCFAISRKRLLSFDFPDVQSKMDGCRFESGYDSVTAQVRHRGLSALVVGKDGIGYDVHQWPASRTFRLHDQSNVLVSDNQVRKFTQFSPEERATHILMTWGSYADRLQTNRVPTLGKTFEQAEFALDIMSHPPRFPAPALDVEPQQVVPG
ncbi:hypothetical protein [Bradyrhizobium sp. SZCCHNS1054]|uniref:hypothetical protein n=1 Tax=Bradyrhizobium sp. SZCCHNS1054 TaxID=3057301 RepID=UPI0029170516|nr:hypothetical protein [Bradyrhizobium sp. SZCCHNS1054]